MSKMIPSTIDPEVKSNAERKIFDWFSRLEWKNSVVLHSLGLANHSKNIFGEIDFVFISNQGILCIEVKGGRVGRQDGQWTFTNRFNQVAYKHKGPFEQAQENMHSLRNHLIRRLKRGDRIIKCQYASAVMTPDSVFNIKGPEVNEEILFDGDLKEKDLKSFLENAYKYWRNTCIEKHGFEGELLSNNDIERVVNLLRGDFQLAIPLSTIISRTEESLLALTDEQFLIMQGFSTNKRMLITGPAGTGKTVLAVEECIRAWSEGNKVLYLCYNRLNASNVRKILKHRQIDNIEVQTLHSLMLNYLGLQSTDALESENSFFKMTLPELFLEKCEGEGEKEKIQYDKIVIDEGQDLMKTDYYMCINELIKDGFSQGRWTIYFDPNQNIFGAYEELEDIWRELLKDSSSYELSINCRNTRQIAVANQLITNIGQAKIMKAEGLNVEYFQTSSSKNALKSVLKSLRNLRAQGVSLKDIVLLSPYLPTNEKSCLYNSTIPYDIGTLSINSALENSIDNTIRFYTIHSFKGLESRVVLLLDVDDFEDEERRLLNYVGVSRARILLYVFYDEAAEIQRQNMLLKSYV